MQQSGWKATGPSMPLTLGEVVRAALPALAAQHRLPAHHWKVLRALAACHTPALGGHQYRCAHCGKELFVPHSCGNRHCSACQRLKGAQWLEAQAACLLPIGYFHIVFTLPHELNGLIKHNQSRLYQLLFASATATLLEFGRNNLQATLGVTAVLHTWGQNLSDHYHLHCVVTGGGVALDGQRWVSSPAKWLFPVHALSRIFRAKFRDGLQELFAGSQLRFPHGQAELSHPGRWARWLRRCCRRSWVVYAKRPFAGPKTVLAYLCRYTHRVAITNSRLEALDAQNGTVRFRYKDYAQGSQTRSMTLGLAEFLRRFCLHILPRRFVKIRHYGLLANRDRPARLAQARKLLAQVPSPPPQAEVTVLDLKPATAPSLICPQCGETALVLIRVLHRPFHSAAWDSS
jgi:hypothetical protein